MTDQAVSVLKELLASANGRLFTIGSLLCGGSTYYILDKGSDEIMFAYASLGIGTFMILTSMVMAFFAKYLSSKERMEIRKLDAEIRMERMERGEADRTIYKFEDDK